MPGGAGTVLPATVVAVDADGNPVATSVAVEYKTPSFGAESSARGNDVMYRRLLQILKEHVRTGRYVMTLHAEEEMDDDGLDIYDVENAVWTGVAVRRQQDRETREWKYVVTGAALDKSPVTVVMKLSPTGKCVILTVFRS